MRTELYADSRDEWKWSVIAFNAGQRAVRWVAMLRPDIGEHGEDWNPVPEAHRSVTEFFGQERTLLEQGMPRELQRTSLLFQRLGIPFVSDMTPYRTSLNLRTAYVNRLIDTLDQRRPDCREIVFLDPDNGFGRSRENGQQVYASHLTEIWQSLRPGDSLAIIQFQHHVHDWVGHLRADIGGLLDIRANEVAIHPWSNTCIYIADRR